MKFDTPLQISPNLGGGNRFLEPNDLAAQSFYAMGLGAEATYGTISPNVQSPPVHPYDDVLGGFSANGIPAVIPSETISMPPPEPVRHTIPVSRTNGQFVVTTQPPARETYFSDTTSDATEVISQPYRRIDIIGKAPQKDGSDYARSIQEELIEAREDLAALEMSSNHEEVLIARKRYEECIVNANLSTNANENDEFLQREDKKYVEVALQEARSWFAGIRASTDDRRSPEYLDAERAYGEALWKALDADIDSTNDPESSFFYAMDIERAFLEEAQDVYTEKALNLLRKELADIDARHRLAITRIMDASPVHADIAIKSVQRLRVEATGSLAERYQWFLKQKTSNMGASQVDDYLYGQDILYAYDLDESIKTQATKTQATQKKQNTQLSSKHAQEFVTNIKLKEELLQHRYALALLIAQGVSQDEDVYRTAVRRYAYTATRFKNAHRFLRDSAEAQGEFTQRQRGALIHEVQRQRIASRENDELPNAIADKRSKRELKTLDNLYRKLRKFETKLARLTKAGLYSGIYTFALTQERAFETIGSISRLSGLEPDVLRDESRSRVKGLVEGRKLSKGADHGNAVSQTRDYDIKKSKTRESRKDKNSTTTSSMGKQDRAKEIERNRTLLKVVAGVIGAVALTSGMKEGYQSIFPDIRAGLNYAGVPYTPNADHLSTPTTIAPTSQRLPDQAGKDDIASLRSVPLEGYVQAGDGITQVIERFAKSQGLGELGEQKYFELYSKYIGELIDANPGSFYVMNNGSLGIRKVSSINIPPQILEDISKLSSVE